MPLKYNRLKQGYKEITEDYKQMWINFDIYADYQEAINFLHTEGIENSVAIISTLMDKFKFATYEQIEKYLDVFGVKLSYITLEGLVEHGFLNTFVISAEKDALESKRHEVFYSIGVNLSLYIRRNINSSASRMLVEDVYIHPMKIIQRLDSVDLYINMISSYGSSAITEFEVEPHRVLSREVVAIDMEVKLDINGLSTRYIVLNVSRYNVNRTMTKRLEKINKLLKSLKMLQYYKDENIKIILLCENESVLEYATKKLEINPVTELDKLYILAVDEIVRVNISEYNEIRVIEKDGEMKHQCFA